MSQPLTEFDINLIHMAQRMREQNVSEIWTDIKMNGAVPCSRVKAPTPREESFLKNFELGFESNTMYYPAAHLKTGLQRKARERMTHGRMGREEDIFRDAIVSVWPKSEVASYEGKLMDNGHFTVTIRLKNGDRHSHKRDFFPYLNERFYEGDLALYQLGNLVAGYPKGQKVDLTDFLMKGKRHSLRQDSGEWLCFSQEDGQPTSRDMLEVRTAQLLAGFESKMFGKGPDLEHHDAVAAKAYFEQVDCHGNTRLVAYLGNTTSDLMLSQFIEAVHTAIQTGADLRIANSKGNNLLMMAAYSTLGDAIIKDLVVANNSLPEERRMDYSWRNDAGEAADEIASRQNNPIAAQWLRGQRLEQELRCNTEDLPLQERKRLRI